MHTISYNKILEAVLNKGSCLTSVPSSTAILQRSRLSYLKTHTRKHLTTNVYGTLTICRQKAY